jgi:hypothetical protein
LPGGLRNEKVGCSIHLSGTKIKPRYPKGSGVFFSRIFPSESRRQGAGASFKPVQSFAAGGQGSVADCRSVQFKQTLHRPGYSIKVIPGCNPAKTHYSTENPEYMHNPFAGQSAHIFCLDFGAWDLKYSVRVRHRLPIESQYDASRVDRHALFPTRPASFGDSQ